MTTTMMTMTMMTSMITMTMTYMMITQWQRQWQTTDGNNLFMPLYHISCLCHRQCQRSCLQFMRLWVDQSLRKNMFLSLWFSVSVLLTRPLSLFPSLALSLPRMISRFLSLALSFSFTPILILACDWMISSRVHACHDVTKVSGRRRRRRRRRRRKLV